MNRKYLNKILSIILILLISGHSFGIHNALDNLIVCYGNDGHIEIENIDDCNECGNIVYYQSNRVIIKSIDCEDYALNLNCLENNNVIINKTFQIENKFQKIVSYLFIPESENLKNQFSIHLYSDNIHISVKSVSLLI